jgi:hypothetical protein
VKLEDVATLVPYESFVWFENRMWVYEGLVDCEGRHSLFSPMDPSLGTGAFPEDLREVSPEQEEAMLWWIQHGERR